MASGAYGAEEFHVAAFGGGVDGDGFFDGVAVQVVGAAGLGAGAGQAHAAEGLHAHHGAHHVAVYIYVAYARVRDDFVDTGVDAALDAQREAEFEAIDRVHEVGEAIRVEGQHVHDRAEAFALQLGQAFEFDDVRAHVRSVQRFVEPPAGPDRAAQRAHALDVGLDALKRRLVDYGADVG